MRFIKQRPSGADKDIPVFEFAFGPQELRLLLVICKHTRRHLPEMFETNQMRNRLNNIVKSLQKVANEHWGKNINN